MVYENPMQFKFQCQKQSFNGTWPHPFIYVLSLAALVLQCQSSVVATKTIMPQS